MDPEAVRQFDDFWREIGRAEEFIRQYGHTGWDPSYRERWDEPLEQAYEAIRPHLAPVVYPRMIITPVEFPNLRPYEAETAHQALMYFLNPPENLFGYLGALDSEEYPSDQAGCPRRARSAAITPTRDRPAEVAETRLGEAEPSQLPSGKRLPDAKGLPYRVPPLIRAELRPRTPDAEADREAAQLGSVPGQPGDEGRLRRGWDEGAPSSRSTWPSGRVPEVFDDGTSDVDVIVEE